MSLNLSLPEANVLAFGEITFGDLLIASPKSVWVYKNDNTYYRLFSGTNILLSAINRHSICVAGYK